MFEICFKNEFGNLLLCGAGGLLEPVSVSGLARPETADKTAVFGFLPGQKCLISRDKARRITIEGHAFGDYRRVANACRVLYAPGVLTLKNAFTERAIAARCISVSDKKQLDSGGYFVKIDFVCDNPYFHDPSPVTVPVYSRLSLLESPFTLPCTISRRVTEGVCPNPGQVAAEPILTITNHGEAQTGFTIKNLTTGVDLEVNTAVPAKEVITISVPDRTITNTNGQSLLKYIADTSYISDFYLQIGNNNLKFISNGDIRCVCTYQVNYIESIL